MKDAEAFTKNNWGNKSETLSGSGSTIANTVNIRRELPLLVERWNIQSIFDAPCGDGNWISTIRDQLNCEYSGGDLVESFWQSAASKGLTVNSFDIRESAFPHADLWLCRACLYHLPFADIEIAIKNYINSDIPYALITSHVKKDEKRDIKAGEFRRLVLREHSYLGLGEPIDSFTDVEHGPQYGNMVEEMLLFRNPRLA